MLLFLTRVTIYVYQSLRQRSVWRLRSTMLSQFIWLIGNLLEVILLARGIRGRLIHRYPFFYSYICFVLLQSPLRLAFYRWHRPLYADIYWVTEFLGAAIGCGIVFEAYRVGLAAYPGTARMARRALSFVFLLAVAIALANAADKPGWWAATTVTEIERALRIVQALAIIALALLFWSYRIPFGRNLGGILAAYGLFVGASVVWLTFVYTGRSGFQHFWFYLKPASYDLALGTWLLCLWSYSAVPESQACVTLEQNYHQIAAATRRRLQETRGYLRKAVGS